jgi:isopenicillin N synthase-like dioxygenase
MYSNIPIIDFSPVLHGSLEGRQRTISEIDDALRTIGTFYLQNLWAPDTGWGGTDATSKH